MKIVATPLPSGTAVTLGDDSAPNYIVDPPPMPVTKGQMQVEDLFRGSQPFVAGRGNVSASFNWTVHWLFATAALATAFVWSHGASVPQWCSLTLTPDTGSAVTYSSALIQAVEVIEISGCSVKVRYSVIGATP